MMKTGLLDKASSDCQLFINYNLIFKFRSMPISWNEIKDRAIKFSKEWEMVSSEDVEAKTFWDEFFNAFSIRRSKVVSFEPSAKRLDESTGILTSFGRGPSS